jgi:tripartite motif-containing protein 71
MSAFSLLAASILISTILIVSTNGIVLGQEQSYSFVKSWSSDGKGEGQLNKPHGLDIDPSGNVYIVDTNNYRVDKFDSNGKFIMMWGSKSADEGQFLHGHDIAIDSSGNIYVNDVLKEEGTNHARVEKFDSNGKFIMMWGSKGSGEGQFFKPECIAVDSSDYVYVCDGGNFRIQKFDSNGKFITTWGSEGEGDGQFLEPQGIQVDPSGMVYVVDKQRGTVEMFKPS